MLKLQELHAIAKLALPLMAAFFAQKCMQLIDTAMMGWIGPQALAAGALGTAVYITMLVFCMGTLSAVGVYIARARGANDPAEMKASAQHGIILSVLLAVPCMIIVWLAPYFLAFLGEDPAVIASVKIFLHALVWTFPGSLFFAVFREFISAFSYTRVVMVVTVVSIPLTFAANYVLIYGKIGFPKLGIAGIGYANAIVMWFMSLCLLIYSKTHVNLKNYISFTGFKFDISKITSMVYIGAPSGTLFILESGMFLSATIIMGFFGVINLASFQIAMQCASLAYSIPFALSMTAALLVGHAAGARDVAQLERSAFLCFGAAIIFSVGVAFLFILAPDLLVKIFLENNVPHYEQVLKLASHFLFIAAFFQCFDAIQGVANGSLRGMRDTLIPMLVSVGCYWFLAVPSAYLLSFHTHLGADGVWYGITIGISSIGFILILRFFKQLNREREKS